MKLWKFDSGIYPVIPGLDIKLGDYGYWQDNQWCHIGNIEQLPLCPKEFSKKDIDIKQAVSESLEVSIEGTGNADVELSELKAGMKMVFKKKNSQIFVGELKKYIQYVSIDMEIAPFLEMLQARGIWESKYWLAYYVVYSNNFMTLRSKSAGVAANISADLSLEDFKDVKTGLLGKISFAREGIESVASIDGALSFAGAKFISLQERGLFRRNVTVKYNASDPDEILLT